MIPYQTWDNTLQHLMVQTGSQTCNVAKNFTRLASVFASLAQEEPTVTADLAVRVTLFTLLAGFAVTFLTETTVSLTVLGDADLAVLVAEVLLRVAINVKSKKIGVRTYVCRGSI